MVFIQKRTPKREEMISCFFAGLTPALKTFHSYGVFILS